LDQAMAHVDKEAIDAGKNEQHQQQADDKWVCMPGVLLNSCYTYKKPLLLFTICFSQDKKMLR
jgi:hypothetical protein